MRFDTLECQATSTLRVARYLDVEVLWSQYPYVEVYMDKLTKKTTILLQPELHRRLTRLADQRGTSLGELMRSACEKQYGIGGSEDRIRAARAIGALELPVGSPAEMKRESQPQPDEFLP
jgi:predicted DNA-binding protein